MFSCFFNLSIVYISLNFANKFNVIKFPLKYYFPLKCFFVKRSTNVRLKRDSDVKGNFNAYKYTFYMPSCASNENANILHAIYALDSKLKNGMPMKFTKYLLFKIARSCIMRVIPLFSINIH